MNRRFFLRSATVAAAGLIVGDEALELFDRLRPRSLFAFPNNPLADFSHNATWKGEGSGYRAFPPGEYYMMPHHVIIEGNFIAYAARIGFRTSRS